MKWNGNTEWRQKRIQRIPGLKTYLHIPMKYTSAMKEGYSRNNLQQRKKLYQMYTQRNTTSYSYRNMLDVRTSETHLAAPHVPLFSVYHILTSLMIYYWTDPQQHRAYLITLQLPDQICNSPYCQPYNFHNVSVENLVLDELIIPKLILFFILITYRVNIVLI